ncbi:hypothetical protein [Aquimarina sp. MMG016]|uniref:hypothetical protein n=1 Tax=Aquimarina sp. MMG016 TaxID=2822690 RepID=UPI001B3A779A|nr:hypothetical protein [Aquimarina sp. MMG016]MBQ4821594.1 hypothetical protein [Aquimarina sp. MMG016]
MKNLKNKLLVLCVVTLSLAACSSDDDPVPVIDTTIKVSKEDLSDKSLNVLTLTETRRVEGVVDQEETVSFVDDQSIYAYFDFYADGECLYRRRHSSSNERGDYEWLIEDGILKLNMGIVVDIEILRFEDDFFDFQYKRTGTTEEGKDYVRTYKFTTAVGDIVLTE